MSQDIHSFEFPSFDADPAVPSYHHTPKTLSLPDLERPPEAPPSIREGLIPGSRVELVEHPPEPFIPEEKTPSRSSAPSPALIKVSAEAFKLRMQKKWKRVREHQLQAQLDEARRQGFEEGYRQAQQELQEHVEQTLSLFTRGWESLQKQYTATISELEEPLLKMVFTLIEHILHIPLPPAWATTLQQLLLQTIEEVATQSPATIHLASTDYLALQESGIIEQLHAQHPTLQWVPVPEMRPGEWIVESPTEVISREFSRLLQTLQEELGLPSDTDEKDAS